MLDIIQIVQSIMIFSLCAFGGVTLIFHKQKSKAKKILGWSMLSWALLIAARLYTNSFIEEAHTIFYPEILIIGIYVFATTTCYVIEILRPGYLTIKRLMIFLSPGLVQTILFIGYCMAGYEIHPYSCIRDLFASFDLDCILRSLLLLTTVFYMVLPAFLVLRYSKEYTTYISENVSNPEDFDLGWLKKVMIILSFIYILYFILLITNNLILYILNKSCIMILWYYFFYHAVFLKDIYLTHSFRSGWNIPYGECLEKEREQEVNVKEESPQFYLKKIQTWFEQEKPYLRYNLKLIDVQKELYIGRTYLSLLFNKELGIPFTSYVNQFRIERCKALLEEEPNADLQDIAERCGFNSYSTFRRAFLKHTGMSLAEYRKKLNEKRNENISPT
ncbi:helix-turn-helix domain-containing protein [uncultured Parabacteroides sp.]|uniref:helix-turn-helix domain-containing protein n=1 Tax=uncultured Parabacteroides sp. TaxID=512312 RepID=UPI002628A449|nr:helix-turn-helix domain-containing protein [uncultured Parabacteroides sp.]